MMPPRQQLNVVRLSDHGGQYLLILSCGCGHTREARPHTFAAIMGWEALLADVLKRMRCSACGGHSCTATMRRGDETGSMSGPPMCREAWRDYGAALLEQRRLMPSNIEFGKWVIENGLNTGFAASHETRSNAMCWLAIGPLWTCPQRFAITILFIFAKNAARPDTLGR